MTRITLFIALLSGAGVVAYLLLNGNGERAEDIAAARPPLEAIQQEAEPGAAAQEQQRRAAMRAEYAKLEQARSGVRKQLGRLKTVIWKLRVPPEQARTIEKRMYQGHILLKNPPLLGAFSSVDEISRELGKVSAARTDLENLEAELVKD